MLFAFTVGDTHNGCMYRKPSFKDCGARKEAETESTWWIIKEQPSQIHKYPKKINVKKG